MSDRKCTSGKWLTKALFYEERHDKYTPSFTLREEDRQVGEKLYPSLRRIYLEYADPTEYSFAKEVIGSWDHWKILCDSYVFRDHIAKWREELEIKLRSSAIKSMISTATQEGSAGTTAAKYIAEKGWEKKAGRPSKADVAKERKIQAGIHGDIEEDAERMGLLN